MTGVLAVVRPLRGLMVEVRGLDEPLLGLALVLVHVLERRVSVLAFSPTTVGRPSCSVGKEQS